MRRPRSRLYTGAYVVVLMYVCMCVLQCVYTHLQMYEGRALGLVVFCLSMVVVLRGRNTLCLLSCADVLPVIGRVCLWLVDISQCTRVACPVDFLFLFILDK